MASGQLPRGPSALRQGVFAEAAGKDGDGLTAVAVGVTVAEDVAVGVASVGEAVGVAVAVGAGVPVIVGVAVGLVVAVGVAVGVRVGAVADGAGADVVVAGAWIGPTRLGP